MTICALLSFLLQTAHETLEIGTSCKHCQVVILPELFQELLISKSAQVTSTSEPLNGPGRILLFKSSALVGRLLPVLADRLHGQQQGAGQGKKMS